MKQFLSIISLLVLCSCSSGVRFDISGRLTQNAAHEVYLVVQNTSTDTIAVATVDRSNHFRLRVSWHQWQPPHIDFRTSLPLQKSVPVD